MTRVDDILALIDTGLQTAGDIAYGDDQKGTCWRCRAPGDDLCAGCREELLAEVERPVPGGPASRSILEAIASHVATCPICANGYLLRPTP